MRAFCAFAQKRHWIEENFAKELAPPKEERTPTLPYTRTALNLPGGVRLPIEATEEAILNSMLRATSMDGHQGSRADALPIGRLRKILKQYGR